MHGLHRALPADAARMRLSQFDMSDAQIDAAIDDVVIDGMAEG